MTYVQVPNQIINENPLFLILFFFSTKSNVESTYDGVHKSVFPSFPQPLGKVAKQCLEEEYKANPLIVGIVLLSRFVIIVVGNTRMSHGTGWSQKCIWKNKIK